MLLHRSIFLSTSAVALATCLPAYAQSGAGGAAVAEDRATGFEDIVVTARRRAEAEQDVPQSISVVSAEEIQRQGLRSTEDLASAVPGILIGGQRRDEAQFFIRGQGPGPITTGQRNFTSVATYFAEVPASISGPGVFYDLESVQVLKGPQGTLFGRNTTGGAVLFEPHRPEYKNGGYAKVSYGNHDFMEFEGVVNVMPVPDKVAVRLAGQVSRRDGYTVSVNTGQKLDERDYEAFRGSLLLNPTDAIESLTIVDYRNKDNAGGSAVLTAVNAAEPFGAVPVSDFGSIPNVGNINDLIGVPAGSIIPLRMGGNVNIACIQPTVPDSVKGAIGCPNGPFGYALSAFAAAYNGGNLADPAASGFYLLASGQSIADTLALQQSLGPRKTLVADLTRFTSRDLGVTNKTTVGVGDNITLKNIVAFRKSRKNEFADYDGTPLPLLSNLFTLSQPWSTGIDQFTEEFQLQGQVPSANLSYILGVFYDRSSSGITQQVQGYVLGDSASAYSNRVSRFKDRSTAVFGHFEWQPLDLIGITGGIRQTWDKRFVTFNIFDTNGNCTQVDPVPGGTVLCPQENRAKFDALTYDATVNIKPARNILIYGRYAHGYKSGGINLPAPPAPAGFAPDAFQTFGPEKVDSYEIGLKADWNFGIPVRTNIALFYDKYKALQLSQPVPSGGVGQSPVNIVRNDISATNKGFDFEGAIIPFPGFTVGGFVSYLKANADETAYDLTEAQRPVVFEGRQFAFQPKWTYGINGSYVLPLSPGAGEVTVSANWYWRDDVFNANTVTIRPVNPAYGVLNARVDWKNVLDKGFDLAVFGTNLTDKVYIAGGYPISQLGFDSAVYGEPRMYGVSLTVPFGQR